MSRFVPKRGIGAACQEAARQWRLRRVIGMRRRHWDRLGEVRHQRVDNALFGEMQRLNGVTIMG